MKVLRFILPVLFLATLISACKQETGTSTSTTATTEDKQQLEQLEANAEEKKFSPSRRLEAFIVFPDENNQIYRITVADLEQGKVIFSREMEMPNKANFEANKIDIEALSDELVLIKQTDKAFAGNTEASKYFLLQPDSADLKELNCDTEYGQYKLASYDLQKKTYKCEINGKASEEKSFPSFDNSKISQTAESQVVEEAGLKAELTPFDKSKNSTLIGERATLKVLKEDKLLYQKSFSGKCTGCKWVNQDNFKEAFRIQQVSSDEVLLTQIIYEGDATKEETSSEPLYTSMLIVPSRNKVIHLDCNEQNGEVAFVEKIDAGNYVCKFVKSLEGKVVSLPLPKDTH